MIGNRAILALINSSLLFLIIILIGLFIDLIQTLIAKILVILFGANFTNIFLNRITFIGVMHHELSHTILAFLTGAKILKISLFKPEDDTLGKVEYATRGPFLIRGIQYMLASTAPVICGIVSSTLIIKYLLIGAIWKICLISFILLCIIIHMNLSLQDVKVALKGLPACFIIVFLAFYITQFTLVKF